MLDIVCYGIRIGASFDLQGSARLSIGTVDQFERLVVTLANNNWFD